MSNNNSFNFAKRINYFLFLLFHFDFSQQKETMERSEFYPYKYIAKDQLDFKKLYIFSILFTSVFSAYYHKSWEGKKATATPSGCCANDHLLHFRYIGGVYIYPYTA